MRGLNIINQQIVIMTQNSRENSCPIDYRPPITSLQNHVQTRATHYNISCRFQFHWPITLHKSRMIASNDARISHHVQNCFFLFVRAFAVIHTRLLDESSTRVAVTVIIINQLIACLLRILNNKQLTRTPKKEFFFNHISCS